MSMPSKLVSEKFLEFLREELQDLIAIESEQHVFQGAKREIFENLLLFTSEKIYQTARDRHYLAMDKCHRFFNRNLWQIRYAEDIFEKGHTGIKKDLSLLAGGADVYDVCDKLDEKYIKAFPKFAVGFDKEEYITLDYFHPAGMEDGLTVRSPELAEIVRILGIDDFDFDEIEELLYKNIDSRSGELVTYRNKSDQGTYIKIDTCSYSVDQIHPVTLLVKFKQKFKDDVDSLLVKWCRRVWGNRGPYVGISITDRFETEEFFKNRLRVER